MNRWIEKNHVVLSNWRMHSWENAVEGPTANFLVDRRRCWTQRPSRQFNSLTAQQPENRHHLKTLVNEIENFSVLWNEWSVISEESVLTWDEMGWAYIFSKSKRIVFLWRKIVSHEWVEASSYSNEPPLYETSSRFMRQCNLLFDLCNAEVFVPVFLSKLILSFCLWEFCGSFTFGCAWNFNEGTVNMSTASAILHTVHMLKLFLNLASLWSFPDRIRMCWQCH